MLLKTTNLQNSASNPSNSVFVSASAGSGKTKVLTDRVLRLLLCGVAPAKILCLTFTKVAAAQMQKRIFSELRNWVIFDDEKLKNHLKKLTNKNCSPTEIKNARKLFAILLDDNSGLQISTIHSFCQSIIKKFPVEAKTSPSFVVIDEQTENKLLLEARKNLLQEALQNKSLAEKINLISSYLNENSFLDITSELIKKRQNLAELKEKYFGIDAVIKAIYNQLEVDSSENEETVFANFISDKNWQKDDLLTLCNQTEIKSKKQIQDFILEPNLDNLSEYLNVFLTLENEPRKQLTTKAIQKQIAEADEIMQLEQNRVLIFLERFNTVKIAFSTASLLIIVDKIIEIYTQLKNQNGYLDYSDLIIKTSSLLENSAQREWVKYKLDGSYEHILVDESQDTNHQQWNIVKAITEEFFAGNGVENFNKNIGRSIFIVGDEKQSIYSFQGADPDIFANIFYYYQEKLGLINEQFLNVELNSSFRSFPAILQLVDKVFSNPKLHQAISTLSPKIEHYAINNHHFGKVELLSPINCKTLDSNKEDEYRWKLDFTVNEEYKSQEILAQIIAKKIKEFFTQGKFLASKNRLAEFGDVMILLKERKSNLSNLLIKYLTKEQIPVGGADRIYFNKNIIVQDLLSLAKFMLLPQDDLNLACMLKSPFFAIDEEKLENFCSLKNQNQISLFSAIKEQDAKTYQQLENLLLENQKQQFSIQQFFSYVLIRQDKRKAFLSKFGKAADDIINQFLRICLDYQTQNIATSMQHFVQFLESGNFTVKIDSSSQNKNQVYISTIHSAKGLEAPIVFLVDTIHSPQKQIGNDKRRIFWDRKSALPFWSLGKIYDNKDIKKIKQQEREISKNEYWRQLYVAMTRAKEELYICGVGEDVDKNCWYNAIKEAMQEASEDKTTGSLIFGEDFTKKNSDQLKPIQNKSLPKINQEFLSTLPNQEFSQEFLYPSNPNKTNLRTNQEAAYLGKIIHKILEFLPNLKLENTQKRSEFLEKYLEKNNLNQSEIKNIINRIENILEKFADIFSHSNSKAEVPIIGNVDGKIISGKIDRLIIEDNLVLIIDFKTGQKNDYVQAKYQEQMRLYEAVLSKIYPNKEIKSQIIWIDFE